MFSFILFQILIHEGVDQQEAKEAAEEQEIVDEEKGVEAKRKYLKNRKLRTVVKFQTIRTGMEQLSTYGCREMNQ